MRFPLAVCMENGYLCVMQRIKSPRVNRSLYTTFSWLINKKLVMRSCNQPFQESLQDESQMLTSKESCAFPFNERKTL